MSKKSRSIKNVLLSLMIVAMLFTQLAGGKVEAASITEVPEGYIGIYTADDLDNIRDTPNGKYILMNNIDLSGYNQGAGWEPISQIAYTTEGIPVKIPFTGIFDGNGYNIRNLTINRPGEDNVGLFMGVAWDCNLGEVKNLDLTNVNIIGNNSVGAIAGGVGGKATNCTVSGSIKGKNFVGGITGSGAGGVLTNCRTSGNVTGTGIYVSSIVGQSIENTLVSCSSNATVSGSTGTLTGGMGNRRTQEGFWYNVLFDKAEIYLYVPMSATSGHVNIPSSLNGYPVSKVNGFAGNQYITGLTLPNTIEEIGQFAFANLGELSSVVIPANVKKLEYGAFDGVTDYSGLKSITFESAGTVIHDSPFTIQDTATIRGKANSTAQAYATKYNRKFITIP